MSRSATRSISSILPVVVLAVLVASGASGPDGGAATERVAAVDPVVESEQRVRDLLASGDWRAALDAAQSAHRAHPDAPGVAVVLAEALFRAGRLEAIGPLLEPIVAAGDRSAVVARALVVLARLRAAEGRRAETRELVERAVELAPVDRDVLYWAGDLAHSRALAIEWLERYLEQSAGDDPDRIEAAKGSVRVLRELGERRVWVAESSPDRLELPLRPLHSAAQAGAATGYVVQARVGPKAKPMTLLLDTGSHGLFVLTRTAKKRGFEPVAERTVFGGGGAGRHATVRGVFSTFGLGALGYRDALATASPAELDATGRFHGLLGISIFGGYRLTLDLKERRLRAARNAAPLDGEPYWWVSGQLLVRVSAWTNPDRQGAAASSGLFILDTGAAGSVVADAFVREIGAAGAGQAVPLRGYGGAVGGARQVRGLYLGFQGLSAGQSGLVAVDLSLNSRIGGVEVSGLLGLDLLAGRRIELDTVHQRLRIAP